MPSAYRDRIFHGLTLAGGLLLLPFAFNNFLQGRTVLGALTALICAVFLANPVALALRKSPPIPAPLALVPSVVALGFSAHDQGVVGVFWSYPALVLYHFVLDRRVANLFSAMLILLVTAIVLPQLGLQLAVRVLITLFLLAIFANIFSRLVGGLQRDLHELAIRDPLTGAFNRRHMDACLDAAIERHRRHGTSAALLVLDLDHFKRINDEHGHGAGDRVLVDLVGALGGRLRRLDLLFRSGGEEFVVLLAECDAAGAETAAESLRAAIAATPLVADLPVTASLGVAELLAGDDRDHWLGRADRALYEAKRAGRDRVVCAPGPPRAVAAGRG
jgi:diguanylate cyclase (GGDEF)-like protein